MILPGKRHKNFIDRFKGSQKPALKPEQESGLVELLHKAGWSILRRVDGKKDLKEPSKMAQPSSRTGKLKYWMWIVRDLVASSEAARAQAVQTFILDSLKCKHSVGRRNQTLELYVLSHALDY